MEVLQIEKLVDRINILEDRVNAIDVAFQTHTHIVISGGDPTATPVPPRIAVPLLNTLVPQIENPDITHGPKA